MAATTPPLVIEWRPARDGTRNAESAWVGNAKVAAYIAQRENLVDCYVTLAYGYDSSQYARHDSIEAGKRWCEKQVRLWFKAAWPAIMAAASEPAAQPEAKAG
jgi:hypothetical protein